MKIFFRSILRILAVAGVATVVVTAAVFWWSFRDTTIYADGFTEEAFREIEPGMRLEDVHSLVGRPLAKRHEGSLERWCYGESAVVSEVSAYVFEEFLRAPRCVSFNDLGLVVRVVGDGMALVQNGMTHQEVMGLLGEPNQNSPAIAMTLHYTRPGGDGLFRARIVSLDAANRVNDVVSYQFYD